MVQMRYLCLLLANASILLERGLLLGGQLGVLGQLPTQRLPAGVWGPNVSKW